MFHNQANGLIRLAVFPVLLLFIQHQFGTQVPLIAPILTGIFLSISPVAPSLFSLLILGLATAGAAWFQALLNIILIDHLLVYYLMLFVLIYWCMQRIRYNPADPLGALMLAFAPVMAVLARQKEIDVSLLPKGLLKDLLYAALMTHLAHFLLPGGMAIAPKTSSPPSEALHTEIWHLVAKAGILVLVILVVIEMDLAQSLVIAITVANIVKDPNPFVGRGHGLYRLGATYCGFLYVLPILMVNVLQTNLIGQIGTALVCSMLMGIFAFKHKASSNTLQLLYTGFLVLLYYSLTNSSSSALINDGKRLVSIFIAVVIGMLALVLLHPRESTRETSQSRPEAGL